MAVESTRWIAVEDEQELGAEHRLGRGAIRCHPHRAAVDARRRPERAEWMMKKASLQICERLLHHGDAFAHWEQALDLTGVEDEGGQRWITSNDQLPTPKVATLEVGCCQLVDNLVRPGVAWKVDLRHPPVANLGGPKLIRVAAVKLVDRVEFLREPARPSEPSEQLAVQI